MDKSEKKNIKSNSEEKSNKTVEIDSKGDLISPCRNVVVKIPKRNSLEDHESKKSCIDISNDNKLNIIDKINEDENAEDNKKSCIDVSNENKLNVIDKINEDENAEDNKKSCIDISNDNKLNVTSKINRDENNKDNEKSYIDISNKNELNVKNKTITRDEKNKDISNENIIVTRKTNRKENTKDNKIHRSQFMKIEDINVFLIDAMKTFNDNTRDKMIQILDEFLIEETQPKELLDFLKIIQQLVYTRYFHFIKWQLKSVIFKFLNFNCKVQKDLKLLSSEILLNNFEPKEVFNSLISLYSVMDTFRISNSSFRNHILLKSLQNVVILDLNSINITDKKVNLNKLLSNLDKTFNCIRCLDNCVPFVEYLTRNTDIPLCRYTLILISYEFLKNINVELSSKLITLPKDIDDSIISKVFVSFSDLKESFDKCGLTNQQENNKIKKKSLDLRTKITNGENSNFIDKKQYKVNQSISTDNNELISNTGHKSVIDNNDNRLINFNDSNIQISKSKDKNNGNFLINFNDSNELISKSNDNNIIDNNDNFLINLNDSNELISKSKDKNNDKYITNFNDSNGNISNTGHKSVIDNNDKYITNFNDSNDNISIFKYQKVSDHVLITLFETLIQNLFEFPSTKTIILSIYKRLFFYFLFKNKRLLQSGKIYKVFSKNEIRFIFKQVKNQNSVFINVFKQLDQSYLIKEAQRSDILNFQLISSINQEKLDENSLGIFYSFCFDLVEKTLETLKLKVTNSPVFFRHFNEKLDKSFFKYLDVEFTSPVDLNSIETLKYLHFYSTDPLKFQKLSNIVLLVSMIVDDPQNLFIKSKVPSYVIILKIIFNLVNSLNVPLIRRLVPVLRKLILYDEYVLQAGRLYYSIFKNFKLIDSIFTSEKIIDNSKKGEIDSFLTLKASINHTSFESIFKQNLSSIYYTVSQKVEDLTEIDCSLIPEKSIEILSKSLIFYSYHNPIFSLKFSNLIFDILRRRNRNTLLLLDYLKECNVSSSHFISELYDLYFHFEISDNGISFPFQNHIIQILFDSLKLKNILPCMAIPYILTQNDCYFIFRNHEESCINCLNDCLFIITKTIRDVLKRMTTLDSNEDESSESLDFKNENSQFEIKLNSDENEIKSLESENKKDKDFKSEINNFKSNENENKPLNSNGKNTQSEIKLNPNQNDPLDSQNKKDKDFKSEIKLNKNHNSNDTNINLKINSNCASSNNLSKCQSKNHRPNTSLKLVNKNTLIQLINSQASSNFFHKLALRTSLKRILSKIDYTEDILKAFIILKQLRFFDKKDKLTILNHIRGSNSDEKILDLVEKTRVFYDKNPRSELPIDFIT